MNDRIPSPKRSLRCSSLPLIMRCAAAAQRPEVLGSRWHEILHAWAAVVPGTEDDRRQVPVHACGWTLASANNGRLSPLRARGDAPLGAGEPAYWRDRWHLGSAAHVARVFRESGSWDSWDSDSSARMADAGRYRTLELLPTNLLVGGREVVDEMPFISAVGA